MASGIVIRPHWLFVLEAERREVRMRIEQLCAEAMKAEQDGKSPEFCALLALQLGATEHLSNVMGFRIAEAERNLARLP